MSSATAIQAIQQYRNCEHTFFDTLTCEEQTMLSNHGIDPRDSFLYGEFAFVVLGLKPCMLIDLPLLVGEKYNDRVLEPLQPMLASLDLCTCRIDHPLGSREMTNLEGMRVIYQKSQHERIAATFLGPSVIDEAMLASVLDYPGSLPADEKQLETMLEVVYFIFPSRRSMSTPHRQVIMTTFAAQESELGRVREHFKRYQETCLSRLGIKLFLLVRQPTLS